MLPYTFQRILLSAAACHRNGACINSERMTGVDKYSYHQIHALFDNGSLGDIQKVSEEIGLDAVVRRDKWTLLHVASATNRPDVAQYLINMGSDVNVLDKEGKSPLYYCRSEEVAKMMVDAGADVNLPSILGKTPLHHVCISNAPPGAVKILLQSGARVNAEDMFGDTPFLYACGMAYYCIDEEEFAQNLPKINMLLEYGADIHHISSKGENGLHLCSRYGAHEVVEILTKHDVEVNALNKKRQTPLTTACLSTAFALHGQEGILKTLELLLKHGADPMIVDDQGLTPLHVLMLQLRSSKDIASFVDVLVRSGASLNARDHMFRTPVHYASYATAHVGNWVEKLEELMSFGADVNLQDAEGLTAFHVTAIRDPSHLTSFPWPWDCIGDNEKVVQEINWNCARKQGVTLAHMVLSQKGLTLQGCKLPWDVNARDEFGSTPLHYAEFSNNTNATSYLEVSFTRADVTLKNCLGESPITCAVSALNQEMLSLLKCYGDALVPEIEKRLPKISCTLCACFANEGRGIYYQPFEKQEELVSADPEEIQINPARKMEEYLSHVLHTPRMGKVPLHDAEVLQIHQETENLISQILQKVADQDRRFRSTLILSGSVREKTKAGLPNEFDFMCNLELFSSCCKVIDDDTCSPGFVRLEGIGADSANIAEFCDADGFLVPYLVRSKFEQIVRLVTFDSQLWKCRICSNFVLPSLDSGIRHPKPSIIIELCWNGPIYKNMVYSVDLVPVIDAGAFWPQNAISTSRVLENIPKQCLFAMTIPRFERGVYGNEVRISFSLVESAIFDSIPEIVKNAYIAAKAIREVCPTLVDSEEVFHNEANLDAQSLLPTFWLKMALLHELDKYGLDDEGSLTMWVRRIYEKIHQCLCEDEVFPSFFMPQQDFVASYLKGSDLKTSSAGKKLEKKFMACKKMCQLIQRFLSSDE